MWYFCPVNRAQARHQFGVVIKTGKEVKLSLLYLTGSKITRDPTKILRLTRGFPMFYEHDRRFSNIDDGYPKALENMIPIWLKHFKAATRRCKGTFIMNSLFKCCSFTLILHLS